MAIDDPFDWGATATALGQAHAPSRPDDSQIGNGYPGGFPPPAEEFNWLAYMIGLTSKKLGGYDTLEDAVDGLSVGDVAWVNEYDGDQEPGSSAVSVLTGAVVLASVDVTGDSVIYADQTNDIAYAVQRDDLTTSVATYTPSNAGNLVKAISDGTTTVLAYGDYIEAFDHDTGSVLWEYDYTGPVADIAMDGTNVYLVGAVATKQCEAIPIAGAGPKTPTWSYDHGTNALRSVATNGRQVFVGGVASAFASLANARAIWAADGTDAANEGGNGIAADRDVWDVVLVEDPGDNVIATDGDVVVFGYSLSAAHQVEIRSCATGTDVTADPTKIKVISGYYVVWLAVDQDRIYAACRDVTGSPEDGFVVAMGKHDLAEHWRWNQPDAVNDNGVFSVASDGAAVFATKDDASGANLVRIVRGNRLNAWRRVDDGDRYLPMRQQIVPSDR